MTYARLYTLIESVVEDHRLGKGKANKPSRVVRRKTLVSAIAHLVRDLEKEAAAKKYDHHKPERGHTPHGLCELTSFAGHPPGYDESHAAALRA